MQTCLENNIVISSSTKIITRYYSRFEILHSQSLPPQFKVNNNSSLLKKEKLFKEKRIVQRKISEKVVKKFTCLVRSLKVYFLQI